MSRRTRFGVDDASALRGDAPAVVGTAIFFNEADGVDGRALVNSLAVFFNVFKHVDTALLNCGENVSDSASFFSLVLSLDSSSIALERVSFCTVRIKCARKSSVCDERVLLEADFSQSDKSVSLLMEVANATSAVSLLDSVFK